TTKPCLSCSRSGTPDRGTCFRRRRVLADVDRREFVLGAASLALAPRGLGRGLSQREIALVTADLESRLVAVDLASGRVRRYVRTLPKPRSIETVGGIAVVAHSEIGVLTLVRGATLAVTHLLRGF